MRKALKWLCSANNAIALAAAFKNQMIALLLSPQAGQGTRDYFSPHPCFSVAIRGGGSYFILPLCVKSSVCGLDARERTQRAWLADTKQQSKVPPKCTRGELSGGNPPLRPSERAAGTQRAHPAHPEVLRQRPERCCASSAWLSLPRREPELLLLELAWHPFLQTSNRAGKSSWPGEPLPREKSIRPPVRGWKEGVTHLVLFLGVPPAHRCSYSSHA